MNFGLLYSTSHLAQTVNSLKTFCSHGTLEKTKWAKKKKKAWLKSTFFGQHPKIEQFLDILKGTILASVWELVSKLPIDQITEISNNWSQKSEVANIISVTISYFSI